MLMMMMMEDDRSRKTKVFYELWSRHVEKGLTNSFVKHDVSMKGDKCRGSVNIFTKNVHEEWKGAPNSDAGGKKSDVAKKSIDELKQARRCEQFAFRIGLSQEEKRDHGKKLTYHELNKHAAKGLVRHASAKDCEL